MPTWSVECIEACSATGQPDEASESTFLIQHSYGRNGPRTYEDRKFSRQRLRIQLSFAGPWSIRLGPSLLGRMQAPKAGIIRCHGATSGPVAAVKPKAGAPPHPWERTCHAGRGDY
jgi:hypothetical protein